MNKILKSHIIVTNKVFNFWIPRRMKINSDFIKCDTFVNKLCVSAFKLNENSPDNGRKEFSLKRKEMIFSLDILKYFTR